MNGGLLPYIHPNALLLHPSYQAQYEPHSDDVTFSGYDSPHEDWQPSERRSIGSREAARRVHILQDDDCYRVGDFGWNLGYATAFCYRHMIRCRAGVVSALNHARRAPLGNVAPFLVFDMLDRHIFASKLAGMVRLRWSRMENDHPGVTWIPGKQAARICIQLNSTAFDHGGDINDLLRALLHHMIHAYFLVCCGAPKEGDMIDGRLLDGIQFGTILHSINDISEDCEHGSLQMRFHSIATPLARHRMYGRSFIALDPGASSTVAPIFEGHSCCQLDNRHVTLAHVINWQIEEYARHIHENWESRGDEVYVPQADAKMTKTKRINGPPSRQYSEMIWKDKRVAVDRARASKCSTLVRMGTDNKFGDAKIPDCSREVFHCLWLFVHMGQYAPGKRPKCGPPVLMGPPSDHDGEVTLHVKVCKLADAMRFPELRKQSLQHLNEIPHAHDDAVTILQLIYDASTTLTSELQTWSRKFLSKSERSAGLYGTSNYEKIVKWYGKRFLELYFRHEALRDDCKLAVATMSAGFVESSVEPTLPFMPDISGRVPPVATRLPFRRHNYASLLR